MSLDTDTGLFTGKVDFAISGAVASAATTDLGAVNNTAIITGTTPITSLGTASQAGIKRTVLFTDAVLLTHSANIVCLGNANFTTEANDVIEFTSLSTTIWRMTAYSKLGDSTNGKINSSGLASGCVTASKLGDGAVIPSKLKTKAVVALVDTASTLTAEQLVNSGIFTAVPTADRIQTTDTAVNIVAALTGYQTGTSFQFIIVNTAAFNETLAAGAGVTIVGSAVCNNASATYLAVVNSPTAITIYRK